MQKWSFNRCDTCNLERWNAIGGDIRYAIVLHEYLGLAGLENNLLEYSQYPISSKIIPYVYEKNSYELGQEPKEINSSCEVYYDSEVDSNKLKLINILQSKGYRVSRSPSLQNLNISFTMSAGGETYVKWQVSLNSTATQRVGEYSSDSPRSEAISSGALDNHRFLVSLAVIDI